MSFVTALIFWVVVTSISDDSIAVGDQYSMFVTPTGDGESYWESSDGDITTQRYVTDERTASKVLIRRGKNAIEGHFQFPFDSEVVMMTCKEITPLEPLVQSTTYNLDNRSIDYITYQSNITTRVIETYLNTISRIIDVGDDHVFQVGYFTDFILNPRDVRMLSFAKKYFTSTSSNLCSNHTRIQPHPMSASVISSVMEISPAGSTDGTTGSMLFHANGFVDEFLIFDTNSETKYVHHGYHSLGYVCSTAVTEDTMLAVVDYFLFDEDKYWNSFESKADNTFCTQLSNHFSSKTILYPFLPSLDVTAKLTAPSIVIRGTNCSLWEIDDIKDSYDMFAYFSNDRTRDEWPVVLDVPHPFRSTIFDAKYFRQFLGPHVIHRWSLKGSVFRLQLPRVCSTTCGTFVCDPDSLPATTTFKTAAILSSVVFLVASIVSFSFLNFFYSSLCEPAVSSVSRDIRLSRISTTSKPPSIPPISNIKEVNIHSTPSSE